MSKLPEAFNPAAVPEDDGAFTPLPAGNYVCDIVESEYLQTKNGAGMRIALTLVVAEGIHAGRRLFDSLLMQHANEEPVNIAKKRLRDYCLCARIKSLNETEQLHGTRVTVIVKIRNDPNYGVSNDIKAVVVPRDLQPPKAAAPAAAPQPTKPDVSNYSSPPPAGGSGAGFDDEIPF